MNVVTPLILIVATAILVAKQLGLLPEAPSAKFWRDRVEAAETALTAMTEERDELVATRTLEPILTIVQQVLESQQATLDKLAHFNGSLRHVEDALSVAADGMKALTGTIAELHGIPLRPPKP